MTIVDEDIPAPPCVAALVAGTVALMTEWADPCRACTVDAVSHRARVAQQLVCHLFMLRTHTGLSPALQQVMAAAYERWVGVARSTHAEDLTADGEGLPAIAMSLH